MRDVSYDWTHWSGQLTMVWREAVRRLAVTRLRKADPVISQSQINKLYTCAAADPAWRPGKYFCFSMKIIQLTSGTTLSRREEREALVPGPVIAVQFSLSHCTALYTPRLKLYSCCRAGVSHLSRGSVSLITVPSGGDDGIHWYCTADAVLQTLYCTDCTLYTIRSWAGAAQIWSRMC